MSPLKAFTLGVVLNVICVIAMERVRTLWRGQPPTFPLEPWLWYAALAITIVVTQFCITHASRSDSFPMYVAIGINIAFVLTAAMLNGCRTAGRYPTLQESAALLALITAAFLFLYASAKAQRAHHERQKAAQDSDA